MEIAQEYYHVKEMYAIGSMVTLAPHTVPRDFWRLSARRKSRKHWAVTSYHGNEFWDSLQVQTNLEIPTCYGWRNAELAAANLWVPVPFYLISNDDPDAHRKALEFLDKRLGLSLNFDGIDASVKQQYEKLGRLRKSSPEIDGYIRKLENNVQLTEEEHESLNKAVERLPAEKKLLVFSYDSFPISLLRIGTLFLLKIYNLFLNLIIVWLLEFVFCLFSMQMW